MFYKSYIQDKICAITLLSLKALHLKRVTHSVAHFVFFVVTAQQHSYRHEYLAQRHNQSSWQDTTKTQFLQVLVFNWGIILPTNLSYLLQYQGDSGFSIAYTVCL